MSHKLFEGKHALDLIRTNVTSDVRRNVKSKVKKNVTPIAGSSEHSMSMGHVSAVLHAEVKQDLTNEIVKINRDVINLQKVIQTLQARKKECENVLANMPNVPIEEDEGSSSSSANSGDEKASNSSGSA